MVWPVQGHDVQGHTTETKKQKDTSMGKQFDNACLFILLEYTCVANKIFLLHIFFTECIAIKIHVFAYHFDRN